MRAISLFLFSAILVSLGQSNSQAGTNYTSSTETRTVDRERNIQAEFSSLGIKRPFCVLLHLPDMPPTEHARPYVILPVSAQITPFIKEDIPQVLGPVEIRETMNPVHRIYVPDLTDADQFAAVMEVFDWNLGEATDKYQMLQDNDGAIQLALKIYGITQYSTQAEAEEFLAEMEAKGYCGMGNIEF